MFKIYTIVCGAICVAAGICMGLNELAGFGLLMVGVFVGVLIGLLPGMLSENDRGLVAPGLAVGFLIMASVIGIMPMHGSWLSFWTTLALSLVLAWVAAAAVYNLRANLTDKASLKDISHIAVSLGLPVLGLSLVRYLVETDRSIVSGLIMVVVLAAFGYMLAPRSVVRIPQPKPLRRETTA
ncbi:MAG: hypothetical protein QG636_400 [Patescibacteria group bacterium]|jgi:hypothetical protein|nr:hypothetical protein [Patescibacteria group bacterium]